MKNISKNLLRLVALSVLTTSIVHAGPSRTLTYGIRGVNSSTNGSGIPTKITFKKEFHDDNNSLSIQGYIVGLGSANGVYNKLTIQASVYNNSGAALNNAVICAEFAMGRTYVTQDLKFVYHKQPYARYMATNHNSYINWKGLYSVPAWGLGNLVNGKTQNVTMTFDILAPVPVSSEAGKALKRLASPPRIDVLSNRSDSQLIPTYPVAGIGVDIVAPGRPNPRANASVFHN
jgi:hypothetical protein